MNKWVEQTKIARINVIVIGIAVLGLTFMAGMNIYRMVNGIPVSPVEIGAWVIILVALIERSYGRYTYDADGKGLNIVKSGFFGTRVFEVPYRQVAGIYLYKAKMIGYLKFRRTFRLHSALDAGKVWTIAYRVDNKGKEVNERIYFKPSDDMLKFLSDKMPGKVMVPETQVITEVLSKEE
jgi:hypothetical protein